MPEAVAALRHDPEAGHPLIDGEAGLRPQWLSTVLRRHGLIAQSRVTAVQATPVGNGMLGLNLRLALEYDRPEPSAPATLVAKLASTKPESRESGAVLGLYTRETRFYQELAQLLKQGLARTLFADVSADGRSFCLLFEDLAPARGGDQLSGCSLADAETAIDAAAALHAPLWGDAERLALPWLSRDFMVGMYIEKLPPCVELVAVRFAKLLQPGVIDVARAYAAVIRTYFAMQQGPFTISHQDFRLDNLLFDARGGRMPIAVLDWQTFMPGPGALDAVYFVGAGLLPELRRAHEQSLARRYHAALLAHGVQGYDWAQCWHDYRLHAAHGLIMAIVGAAITTPTERGDQMLSTMINRHALQMIDLDTLSLIR